MMIRLIVKLLGARGLPSARVTAIALLVVAGLIIPVAGRLDSAHGASPIQFDSGTTSGSGLVGDANCNGGVDSVDAALILQFSAGLIPSLGCPQNADANGDGGVSSLDAALVLQYAAGLITSLGGPPPATTPDHFADCLSSAAGYESLGGILVGTPEFIAAIADFYARCNDWITAIGYRPDLYGSSIRPGYYYVQWDCGGISHLLPHPGCALYYQLWGSWS